MSFAGDLRTRLASTREALANRNLARLLFAWGVWVTTDWALLITISMLALERSGPAAVGLVGALRVLPTALLTSPLSVLTDRWSRGRLLAMAYAGWAGLAALLVWSAVTEAPLGVLLVIIGVGSALAAVVRPTLQAIMPTLVGTPSQLITANSAYSTIEALGTVLGPGLCAALLAGMGPPGVFAVLAVLFAAAAVVGLSIRTPYQPAQQSAVSSWQAWLAPLRGFAVLAGRGTRLMVTLFFAQTTMRGLLNVFVVLVATSIPGASEARRQSLRGGRRGRPGGGGRGRRAGRESTGGLVDCCRTVLVGRSGRADRPVDRPDGGLARSGCRRPGQCAADVFGYSLLNRLFPDHLAGRAWGAFHAGSAAVVALGSLAAPLLVLLLGLPGAMLLTGSLLALLPWLAWPWLRRIDAQVGGPEEDVALLRRVPLFAPMSVIGLERLARAAQPMTVTADQTIVREGERTDGFYVVTDGEVSVWRSRQRVRTLGPAEAFGEIALLEAGPRTATVVAERPGRLLRVNSEAFRRRSDRSPADGRSGPRQSCGLPLGGRLAPKGAMSWTGLVLDHTSADGRAAGTGVDGERSGLASGSRTSARGCEGCPHRAVRPG